MTDILAMAPEYDRAVVDYLTAHIDETNVTVGIGVPADWHPGASPDHIEVQSFSVTMQHPIVYRPRVRLIARALAPSQAFRLAAKAMGVLAAHPGDGTIVNAIPISGPDAATDSTTHTELAAVELTVTVRSIPIP